MRRLRSLWRGRTCESDNGKDVQRINIINVCPVTKIVRDYAIRREA